MAAFTYNRLTQTMYQPPADRNPLEVSFLEPWFRGKSAFLKKLPQGNEFIFFY